MNKYRIAQYVIWGAVASVDVAYASSLADQTSQNNLFVGIIGALCVVLFTIGGFFWSQVVSRLNKLEEADREKGEQLVEMQTIVGRCPGCNDSQSSHNHPLRRQTDR